MSRTSFTALLILSFVLPAAVALLAIGACGVGHGDCRLMVIYPGLFPYSFLGGNLFKDSAAIFIALAFLQYPAYVLLLRRAGSRPVRFGLLAAHIIAALIGYSLFLL